MKLKKGNFLCLSSVFITLAGSASAAEIVRDNVAITLNNNTAWVGAIPPGVDDVAVWNSTLATAGNATAALGADLTWDGIKVVNPAAAVVVSAGNALTLEGSGINLSTATQNLTLNSGLSLNGAQTWDVATARNLTIAGTSTNAGSSSLNITGSGNTTINNTAIITSTAGITKAGAGVFQINGGVNQHNLGTSNLVSNGGILALSNPATVGILNMVNPTTNAILGGGALRYTYAVNLAQNFTNLTLNPGESAAFANRNGSFNTSLAFTGTITRQIGSTLTVRTLDTSRGSTVFSALPVGLVTSNGTAYLTTGNVYSGTQVDNFNDWGSLDASKRVVVAGYTATTATTLGTALQNGNVINGVTTTTLAAATVSATFRQGSNQATTVDLNGNTWQTGGILVNSAVTTAGSIIKDTPGTGSLTGPLNSDLPFMISANATTPVSYTVSANIVDNGSTAITKGAPGTLILSGNNTFTGGIHINDGTLVQASAGALNSSGANTVNFNGSGMIAGIANTGPGTVAKPPTLVLGGFNTTFAGLSSANNLSGSIPVVQNANGTAVSDALLTINNAATNTYSGTIQDGTGGGKLALTKSGAGLLTLSGASTTYTGNTIVTAGTLALTGSAVPGATNTVSLAASTVLDVTARTGGSLAIGNAQTLTGSGSVTGGILTGTGSRVTPGSSGVGTLTATSLTVGTGSAFNFEVSTGSTDLVDVTATNGLTIDSGSGINLYVPGTLNKLQTAGTYQLFKYTGTIQGAGVAALTTANVLNPQGGLSYSFAESAVPGFVELTVTGTPLVASIWIATGSGSWADTANWDNATPPNLAGGTATLNGAIGGPSVVTLDGNRTVGALVLDSSFGYTIDAGTPTTSSLTLDNGAGNATINATSGSHTITTPITLLSNTTITVPNLADTLTLSGVISDDGVNYKGIVKQGLGTLNFASAFETPNSFLGGLTVAAGTVQFNALEGLGSGDINVAGGTLRWAFPTADDVEDISSRIVTVGSGGATFDTNGNDVTFLGPIGNSGAGSLIKAGAGTLTLASGNNYTGGIVLKGGVLAIPDDLAIGPVPGSPTTDITFSPGVGNTSSLKIDANTIINPNRGILLANGIGAIDTNGFNATYGGSLTGSGMFKKSGAGNLTLTAVNSGLATGGATISAGTVFVGDQNNLPSGPLVMEGTAGISAGNAFNFSPTVNGVNTIVKTGGNVTVNISTLSGSGTLTVTAPFVTDFIGSMATFTGTLILGGGTRCQGTGGGNNVTLDTGGIHGIGVRGAPFTINIGALTGTGGNVYGSTGNNPGTVATWNIGAKNIATTFGGFFSDGNGPTIINKVGNQSLTLTGASTHTGATNLNVGSLIFNGGSFSGSQINVASDALLTGNGSLAAVSVATGGLIAPGISGIGTLAAKNTVLLGKLTVEVDQATATADMLAVTGSLNLTGGTIDFSVLNGPLTADTYIIGSYTTWNGVTPAELNVPVGYHVDYSFNDTTQIALTTLPPTPYSTWVAGFGLVGTNAAKGTDFDNDGYDNILEFILGGDPATGDTGYAPIPNGSGATTLVFRYNRADASIAAATEIIEVSPDLSDWTTIPPITVTAGNSSGAGYTITIIDNGATDEVTVTIDKGANTSLFARLKAEF